MFRLSALALVLFGCGGLQAPPNSAATERVYEIPHGQTERIAAFDQLDEWVALQWNSAQDVVQTKNERTTTLVVKWQTSTGVVSEYLPAFVRSTGLFKVEAEQVRFTMTVTPDRNGYMPPSRYVDMAYQEWDALMAETPWGPATKVKDGWTPPGSSGACRSDRDCERGSTCGADGACTVER